MDFLKIAQVAPLYESIPPRLYGGTERVVAYLTEELVGMGHQVTLFASGDSQTHARLISPTPKSLRLNKDCVDSMAAHIALLQLVQDRIEHFDIIHYHIDYLHYPLSRLNHAPHITTLHGRLNIPDLHDLYKIYSDMPVVSISQAQRKPLDWLNWVGNVYHGLPATLFKPNFKPGSYLAFLGRISVEKRVDRAIDIAKVCGIPIKIAAKIDKDDAVYFEQNIKKLLKHPLVEYIGEITDAEKEKFLGEAMALLFPIDWPEPFGLVMIEAMACGTPVIAYNHGSVPEIVEHGVSGYIVNNRQQAVEAVRRIELISRESCRDAFDRRFSSSVMSKAYVSVYERMIDERAEKFHFKPADL
ncbi:MAG: glycosyltransferase family 4 protein [Dyadobacter sp.]|uniref:glycosyltransferase family 4 protein n=1 Tax=Dyadobacter sp. TaxID=1914288 RepID=UPI001B295BA6|nr:glycosyltransferase family 4 protein [Dyadobacter sp.]MBO9616570.1 glycosyltransferase family 4 protein [Dyadobacter sp.]